MSTDHKRLFDALVRQQLYVQRVKTGQALSSFAPVLAKLLPGIRAELNKRAQFKVGELTKAELALLLTALLMLVRRTFDPWKRAQMQWLADFASVDARQTRTILTAVTGEDASKRGFPPLYGPKATAGGPRLWRTIGNTPMSAGGLTLDRWYDVFAAGVATAIANRVNQAWTQNEGIDATVAALVGTQSAGFNDGIMSQVAARQMATTATAAQFVHQMTAFAVSSAWFPSYQWVSILDKRTSQTCQDLNGQVFKYGDGPMPPAHPNCRSHTMPVESAEDALKNIPSLSEWLAQQSDAFKATADPNDGMSLDEFGDSVDDILAA